MESFPEKLERIKPKNGQQLEDSNIWSRSLFQIKETRIRPLSADNRQFMNL